MSNIAKIDTLKRIYAVKNLIEEDGSVTDLKIAEELGISLRSVQRYRKYLKELAIADLTNKEIAAKREELYLELLEATGEIKTLFQFYKETRVCPICEGTGILTLEKTDKKGKKTERKVGCTLCNGKRVIHFPKDAKRFFDAWIEAIQLRAKLYGLDTAKVESLTQLNQFNQYNVPDLVDGKSGQILSDMIKTQHEQKLKDKLLDI